MVAIVPSGRVSDDGTLIDRPGAAPAPVGGAPRMRNPVLKGVLPTNSAALRVNDRLALGLAVSSPFSFASDYDEEGWQRYLAIRIQLLTLDFQPSVAVRRPTGCASGWRERRNRGAAMYCPAAATFAEIPAFARTTTGS